MKQKNQMVAPMATLGSDETATGYSFLTSSNMSAINGHGYATVLQDYDSYISFNTKGWTSIHGSAPVYGNLMPDIMLANKIITTATTIGEMIDGLSRDDWKALSEDIADAAFSGNDPTSGLISVIYRWYPGSLSFSGTWQMTPSQAQSLAEEVANARLAGQVYRIA